MDKLGVIPQKGKCICTDTNCDKAHTKECKAEGKHRVHIGFGKDMTVAYMCNECAEYWFGDKE